MLTSSAVANAKPQAKPYKLNRLTNSAVTSPGAADFGPCQAGRS